MISVIIPLYNKESCIATALDSVLAQTCQDFEVIVVDDGSTDEGAAIVEGYTDPRIRLIRQENAGVSAARNRGVAEAKGEYVAFLDADAVWMPKFLEEIEALQKEFPECRAQAMRYMVKSKNSRNFVFIYKIKFNAKRGILTNYFEVATHSSPPVLTGAVCIERALLQELGGFPLGIQSGEDLLTWARVALRTHWAYSLKAYALFRMEGYGKNERPKRIPADIDIVGDELEKLWIENPQIKDLKRYIAQWHRMRSFIYLRLGMRKKCIKEAFIGLRYHPLNRKLYGYVMCAMFKFRV